MQSAVPHRPRASGLKLLGKHQLASVATTALDYLAMILLVSGAGLDPVRGTIIGATVGATSNFLLGRHFIYRARERGVPGQLARYALVAAISLFWNGFGEHLLAVQLGMQYIAARLVVGTMVSLVWNFPLQRYFVFRR